MITNNSYIYSVLQYKHSESTGEAINIGVILYWPETNIFIFKYSKKLTRIKNLYKNFSEKIILEYLKNIQIKCINLSKSNQSLFRISNVFDYQENLDSHFFLNNNNSLQFALPVKAINYFKNPDDVLNNLVDKFFIYNEEKKEVKTHKETILLKKFNDKLFEFGLSKIENIGSKYMKNKVITNETGNKINFDIAWKNGSLNLIKPINFDLNDQKYIADKAYKNYGLFTDLENEAIENNYRYDLLLIRPENKIFYKDYDHALKLLNNLKKIKIVEENDLLDYTKYAFENLNK